MTPGPFKAPATPSSVRNPTKTIVTPSSQHTQPSPSPYVYSSSPSPLVPITPSRTNNPGVIRTLRTAIKASPYDRPTHHSEAGVPPYLRQITVDSLHLPSITKRLDIAARFVATHSGVCIFHLLINVAPITDHSSFNDCDQDFGNNSYYQIWRANIAYCTQACFRCGAPHKYNAFRHGNVIGNMCPNVDAQELIRPLAFIVFHSPPLKKAVFDCLGIPIDAFQSDDHYGIWLGFQSCSSAHLSHLIEILFAVSFLEEKNMLPTTSEFEYVTL
jgi:hypothetical protein